MSRTLYRGILRLLVPLFVVACSESSTAPLHPPTTPSRIGGGTCDPYVDPGTCTTSEGGGATVNLDTWPSVEINVIDGDVDKEYGYIPTGSAALSASYDAPPPCTTETVPVRDSRGNQVHDGGGNLIWQTGYSGACPAGPCYGLWLDERDAYRTMIAGNVVSGVATLASYISPAGHAVRIIKTVGAFVGSVGFVGWDLRNRYQTALYKTNDCRLRSGGYYTYYTVVIK